MKLKHILSIIFAATVSTLHAQVDLGDDLGDVFVTDTVETMYYPDLSGVVHHTPINKVFGPWIFSGYRNIDHPQKYTQFPDSTILLTVKERVLSAPTDTLTDVEMLLAEMQNPDTVPVIELEPEVPGRDELPVAFGSVIPSWLRNSMDAYRIQEDFMYRMMLQDYRNVDYAYWDLPVPPRLPEEDYSFRGFLKRMNIPQSKIQNPEELPVHASGERINWLHVLNGGLQLSQAYISDNWYQGGNNYLAFLVNFLWDVQLNQVYYPKLMFQSTVTYKLAINSTTEDEYHKYSVSQDLFQYNLKAGYKATHNWYYSLTTMFKTQFLHAYPTNSNQRKASFLSPGELNFGLGMTYNKEHPKKKWKISVSIAPASYNLKTCIDSHIDHAQFGFDQDRKCKSEFGSNSEITFNWKIWDNITYFTRMFLFTDYSQFTGDWENTLDFKFNKFFSTQLYAHLRYDSSADTSIAPKWHKWMLKEILSVGLSYTFSTK